MSDQEKKSQGKIIQEELKRQDAKDAMMAGGFAAGTVALFTALAALTVGFFAGNKKK